MEGLELTVLLGVTVLIGALLAPRLRVAAPLVLLVLGLLLGFVPALHEVELPPETVLLLFLPVLLFWESLTSSLRSIKRDFRGIVIMSTLLVVATAFAAAGVAHAMGLSWAAALILGAAVAPPDATAVAALGRMLPRRNFMLLKAESLTNDGTALVLYSIAVGAAVGGSYTPLDITGLVLLSYVGGIAAGAAVAGLAFLVLRRMRDALLINVGLLLTPFAAFLLAETIGASGVLAVVVAGLIVSFTSARISTAASRRQTESAWPLGTFLLNGALFVLVGLQVPRLLREIDAGRIGWLILVSIAVWLVLLLVRFLFQSTSVALIRLLDRRPTQKARRMSYRARVVSAVGGFRGAVSLAIALSVPATLASGDPFPDRDDIVFVTAGVILLTLLVQGPLLPRVVRWAHLPQDTSADDELRLAEQELAQAALAALDDVALEHGVSDKVRERLHRDYEEHATLADPDATSAPEHASALPGATGTDQDGLEASPAPTALAAPASPGQQHEEYVRAKLALLDRKREVLLRLRREGAVDDTVARTVQTRLDVEELRLSGADPID
ncbi:MULTISPECIES: Na+/H+ antiporter [unclassified Rathayibacter]|uniref:Na+/H+ antiporter n=1 Tax=unclassified Rathayibacter TaxID=2609250 RepID=UPI00104F03F3|nr:MULTISPECIES: Na+/H+ antiporter [unclassified Rathayibacter]TCL77867.1 sodium/proton antiporter (CPA1 family) [Rathayibacter sp. PhB192]TCM23790.1 sodium/proton antiporter (CPA1 family) [Rathayibacter sp. PhB179]